MRLFSTEQVSKYHPDKFADQISDAILDACLAQDKKARVAVETLVKDHTVVLGGEISGNVDVDYSEVVRKVAKKLNYEVKNVIVLINEQSKEIAMGVTKDDDTLGAGDQGIVFGYACNDNQFYINDAHLVAHFIIGIIEEDVEKNPNTILRGDAKTQVTIDLDTQKIESILISVCHKEGYSIEYVREYVRNLIGQQFAEVATINPAGIWTIGGPVADCGVTGRKIVCDQYGGFCEVGGGAFSGKDPSKVDRTGSYMARKIAVDLLHKFNLQWCKVQLGFAISVTKPISVCVFCSNPELNEFLSNYVEEHYDLTVSGMIKKLDLLNVNFEKLAEGRTYFSFGGNEYIWNTPSNII